MLHRLTVYTDGGCSGNPGPGGWAFIVYHEEDEFASKSGGERETTNNRMELKAVIEALRWISALKKTPQEICIHTDSQYVKQGISVWIHNWKRNGWKTASKDPVKNRDLWETLDELAQRLPLQWTWVKGHAGVEQNEECDRMVKKEMAQLHLG